MTVSLGWGVAGFKPGTLGQRFVRRHIMSYICQYVLLAHSIYPLIHSILICFVPIQFVCREVLSPICFVADTFLTFLPKVSLSWGATEPIFSIFLIAFLMLHWTRCSIEQLNNERVSHRLVDICLKPGDTVILDLLSNCFFMGVMVTAYHSQRFTIKTVGTTYLAPSLPPPIQWLKKILQAAKPFRKNLREEGWFWSFPIQVCQL